MTTPTTTPPVGHIRRLDATVERVAELAAGVRPTRVLLTVLAAPLYLVGALVAVVWVALVWLAMAAVVGWRDVNEHLRPAKVVELELVDEAA